MSINAVSEELTRDTDLLTAAVRQLLVIDVTPFLHLQRSVVHKYYARSRLTSVLHSAHKVFHS